MISSSEAETKLIARAILENAAKKNRNTSITIALNGELGAGKTRFAQGVAEFLQIGRKITSPTFVLMKKYDVRDRVFEKKIRKFYHLDCYRVNSSKEIQDIGWEDVVSDPGNIILVEWAEKIEDILPQNTIRVSIKETGENTREITVK